MSPLQDGVSSSRKDGRKGRPILSLKRIGTALQEHSQLPGIERGEHNGNDAETQDFEAALWAARNAWDVARRRSGLFGARISRADAPHALKRALAALEVAQ